MSAPSAHDARPTDAGTYDVIVIGGGASGMVAGIRAARLGRSALIVEKSPSLGRKLLASGGQRCNLSNTLNKDGFMERVGRDGRFMGPALDELGGPKLREFFHGPWGGVPLGGHKLPMHVELLLTDPASSVHVPRVVCPWHQ